MGILPQAFTHSPTRLQLLASARGGADEHHIADDELFAADELEGLLRTPSEVEAVRAMLGWSASASTPEPDPESAAPTPRATGKKRKRGAGAGAEAEAGTGVGPGCLLAEREGGPESASESLLDGLGRGTVNIELYVSKKSTKNNEKNLHLG